MNLFPFTDICDDCGERYGRHKSVDDACPYEGLYNHYAKNKFFKSKKENKPGGIRYDAGKSRVDLLPGDALIEVGKVYAYGVKKYSARNWEKGMSWNRIVGSLLRHTFARMLGKTHDVCHDRCSQKDADFCKDHSRLLHTAHILWNALTLLTYEIRKIGEDDLQLKGK